METEAGFRHQDGGGGALISVRRIMSWRQKATFSVTLKKEEITSRPLAGDQGNTP